MSENSSKTNVLFLLVGLPAAGKSTFREDLITAGESKTGYAVISTDDYIEEVAKNLNLTYDAIWSEKYPDADKAMGQYFDFAIERGMDMIIDRCNISKKSRARWVKGTPDFYHRVAVIFETPPKEIHDLRLTSRPGKAIPEKAITDMKDRYEKPTIDEGFDEVIVVNSWRKDEQ